MSSASKIAIEFLDKLATAVAGNNLTALLGTAAGASVGWPIGATFAVAAGAHLLLSTTRKAAEHRGRKQLDGVFQLMLTELEQQNRKLDLIRADTFVWGRETKVVRRFAKEALAAADKCSFRIGDLQASMLRQFELTSTELEKLKKGHEGISKLIADSIANTEHFCRDWFVQLTNSVAELRCDQIEHAEEERRNWRELWDRLSELRSALSPHSHDAQALLDEWREQNRKQCSSYRVAVTGRSVDMESGYLELGMLEMMDVSSPVSYHDSEYGTVTISNPEASNTSSFLDVTGSLEVYRQRHKRLRRFRHFLGPRFFFFFFFLGFL